MAPEMDDEAYQIDDIYGAVDVLLYGMILWELASEKRPFEQMPSYAVRLAIRGARLPPRLQISRMTYGS
jgi:hypothetical protein